MFTMDNFYQSKEWRKLVTLIRMERVDKDGNILCEYCGKPIVREYDCIGHHKEFLTDENVNDYTVSLNPDNIQLLHHACHNRVHNKFGYKVRAIYLVYGAPCAGKSTYVDTVMEPGDLLIDIDKIRQALTNSTMHILVPGLNPLVFGIRDYLYESITVRRGRWNRCYIVGGFPLIAERERICRKYGAREVFIDTPKEECLRRLEAEPDGRDRKEWTGFINEWFERFTAE